MVPLLPLGLLLCLVRPGLANSGRSASSTVENELIVVLRQYHSLQRRLAILAEALEPLPGRPVPAWSVVPRPSVASRYPSDFDVVRVGGTGPRLNNSTSGHSDTQQNADVTDVQTATRLLLASPHVRSVSPQRLVNRRPLAAASADGGKGGEIPTARTGGGSRGLFGRQGVNSEARNAAEVLEASRLWEQGITGQVGAAAGLAVAVICLDGRP